MADNRPIGIFDSGVGGLTIYLEIKKILPRESYIYFADQKNIPYSGKPKGELEKITSGIIRFLLKNKAKIIVIACNTATVYAIDYLRSKFDVPIIGTVPVVKTASERTRNGRIGILSTIATAKSRYQKKLIEKFTNGLAVFNVGTDEIVPFIETGEINSVKLKKSLMDILKQFSEIDVLALGCSHYPFLKKKIQQILGSKILILDSGPAVARQVSRVVLTKNILSNKKSYTRFFTTGSREDFERIARKLAKIKGTSVEKAII